MPASRTIITMAALLVTACGDDVPETCMDDAGQPVEPTMWFQDADGDGFGDPDSATLACEQPEGTSSTGTDCDDGDPALSPGADDVPRDGIDQDCSGRDACAEPMQWFEGNLVLDDKSDPTFSRFCDRYDAVRGNLQVKAYSLPLSDIRCLCEVSGELHIQSIGVTSLEGLENLHAVDRLKIEGNYELVTTEGLVRLESARIIRIDGNAALRTIKALPKLPPLDAVALVDLPALVEWEPWPVVDARYVEVRGTALPTLDGLRDLRSVTTELRIGLNQNLRTLSAIGGLERLDGTLSIHDNPALQDVDGLDQITEFPGRVTFVGNRSLSDLGGLGAVSSFGSDFEITSNDALVRLDGLDNLQSVRGDLSIYNNASLTDVTGMHGLELHDVTIVRNAVLGDEAAWALVESATSVTGNVDIRSNAP